MTEQRRLKRGNRRAASGAMLAAAAAAAGLAAAGYYFYASKDAKKHRKIAAQWAGELKNEVITRAQQSGAFDKKAIARVVDTATAAFAQARNLDTSELARAAKELKSHWQKIARELKTSQAPKIRAGKKSRRQAKKRS